MSRGNSEAHRTGLPVVGPENLIGPQDQHNKGRL